jgi:hypothetical protein
MSDTNKIPWTDAENNDLWCLMKDGDNNWVRILSSINGEHLNDRTVEGCAEQFGILLKENNLRRCRIAGKEVAARIAKDKIVVDEIREILKHHPTVNVLNEEAWEARIHADIQ